MGQRLTVQFARGPRERDTRGPPGPGFYADRNAPRTRRTIYRMTMAGLPSETSWQVSYRSIAKPQSLEDSMIKDLDRPKSCFLLGYVSLTFILGSERFRSTGRSGCSLL